MENTSAIVGGKEWRGNVISCLLCLYALYLSHVYDVYLDVRLLSCVLLMVVVACV